MFDDSRTMNSNGVAAVVLPDIQKTPDERNIPIDRVGVKGVKYPVKVLDRANEVQSTVGEFTLTVDLPAHFKGTHMSRFLEILSENRGEVSVQSIPGILSQLRDKLQAETAHLEVRFVFFMEKAAPVTGRVGLMGYECGFRAMGGKETRFDMLLNVPVATLCPCSKEISKYGAHNQRGVVSVDVSTNELVWLEEVVEMIESAASSPLYPVLKRPDEKFVTELAYDNPRFVEDMVREVAIRFDAEPRITAYKIEVENFESIHDHNAYAMIERSKS